MNQSNSLDRITIKGLSFSGKHGYYPEEREKGNTFEVDVIAEGKFKKAIQENDLDQTFNYELAAACARDIFAGPSELLIETLCFRIGESVFEKSKSVKNLIVRVRKLIPPIEVESSYAEIEMTWKRP
jgi:dihydroneopterin aldolase